MTRACNRGNLSLGLYRIEQIGNMGRIAKITTLTRNLVGYPALDQRVYHFIAQRLPIQVIAKCSLVLSMEKLQRLIFHLKLQFAGNPSCERIHVLFVRRFRFHVAILDNLSHTVEEQ